MISEKQLKTCIAKRCKDCQPDEFVEGYCVGCGLKKGTKKGVLSYCKACLHGNPFEVCNESLCPLKKIIPELKKEIADVIRKK